jgi:hypothetical protein
MDSANNTENLRKATRNFEDKVMETGYRDYKKGGRAKSKKADGGATDAAKQMMMQAQKTAGVPSSGIYGAGFTRTGAGSMSPAGALGKQKLKKGGVPKHDDVKQDMALIKKMVKPEARKGKAGGGGMGALGGLIPMAIGAMGGDDEKSGKKTGGRTKRQTGGGVFSGPGYPGKIPGVVPGGRTARATGGKTKGKTNINIVIAAGKQPGQDGPMPPMPPGARPGGIPIPVPPPQAGGAMGAGAPMPMPMPMPAPAGGPAGGPPMARKAGGRITKVASSYKDMEAGAAGGEGRLQKTDIAKKDKGAPAYKKGGKVYRSFKDMDAGAASGLGRLEKSEIQSRKG